MRILIVSDAWLPQINGVVRTLEKTIEWLRAEGHDVEVFAPDPTRRWTFAAPSYPSIKLEFFSGARLRRLYNSFRPDLVHIATEGPVGWSARRLCIAEGKPFTTSYHTRFPEYLAARMPRGLQSLTLVIAYLVLRRFHGFSSAVMVATASMEQELRRRKFRHIVRWSRGVDCAMYRPMAKDFPAYRDLPRPIVLYVGRVAVEKNLPAFLELETTGSLVVVGDGPDLVQLRTRYPNAHFLGAKQGDDLARHYAAADLFVFPSHTDTFGLVLLEAAASGLAIASVPAPGPSDIFVGAESQKFAVLDPDLQKAVDAALRLPDAGKYAAAFAQAFSWAACSRQFYQNLQATTPRAVRRLTRITHWLRRWWG